MLIHFRNLKLYKNENKVRNPFVARIKKKRRVLHRWLSDSANEVFWGSFCRLRQVHVIIYHKKERKKISD